MIQTIEENFRNILAKPDLKNLALTTIAIQLRLRSKYYNRSCRKEYSL